MILFSKNRLIEAFTYSTIYIKWLNIDSISISSIVNNLSILFNTNIHFILLSTAYFIRFMVYGATPSTTSIINRAPSTNFKAVVTSKPKSIWPGESIKFINFYSAVLPSKFNFEGVNSVILEDFMVISLSYSSSLKSKYNNLPFIFLENIIFDDIRVSVNEVLPWSTWAIMHIL